MLQIAICDDIPAYQQIIQSEIEKVLKLSHKITLFSTGKEFLEKLSEGKCPYQIVFMDIDFGTENISGISIAKKISAVNPMTQIIFISQYLEFASDVYETAHVYFIIKNRLSELLGKALNTALSKLSEVQKQHLYFRTKQGLQKVDIHKIWYMEKNLRNTILFTASKIFQTSQKIEELLEQLPPYFVICHRSYAVNLQVVQSVQRTKLKLPDGTFLPIGRSHYEEVKRALSLLILQKN